jgi:glycosyltransferase involved in cell wall biosynthesis
MRLYGTSENKLSVIHHGFDKFSAYENSIKPIKIIERPFLLYVGQRAGYKNFSGFLQSVARSSRLISDFDIVAFGGNKFTTDELSLIGSLGYRENQVHNIIDNDIILGTLYRDARAFVYPSLYEGFGIPPLEAMANRCPVVSSNTSSMPEIIGDAGEFFNPYEVDDMTRAIEMVVYSKVATEDLNKKGESRLERYSWDKCISATIDTYERLL